MPGKGIIRRGDLVWVQLDPVIGSEANKCRPAVVVSNDGANARAAQSSRGVVTVVPITSNTSKIYPFQVLLTARETGLAADSKAQAEQVRSVDVRRITQVISPMASESRKAVDAALKLHLSLL